MKWWSKLRMSLVTAVLGGKPAVAFLVDRIERYEEQVKDLRFRFGEACKERDNLILRVLYGIRT